MKNVFCDGSLSSICYVFETCKPIIIKLDKKVTTNEAEYLAICYALEAAIRLRWKDLTVLSDSQLIVNQLNGDYKIKKPHLLKLAQEVHRLVLKFNHITFTWLPRESNLAGIALEKTE